MPFMSHVNTKGNAREIIDYYVEKLDAEIVYMCDYGTLFPSDDSPLKEDEYDKIANGSIKIHDQYLMFIDTPDFMNTHFQFGNNMGFTLVLDDMDKIIKYYHALSEEGSIIVPISKYYWSDSYAIITDKFGYSWQFIYSEENIY